VEFPDLGISLRAPLDIPLAPTVEPLAPSQPVLIEWPKPVMEDAAFRGELDNVVARFQMLSSRVRSREEHADYAVALIFLGRAPEAIPLLHKLEKERPGEYATAANLGTAYELVGDLAASKEWIKRGIERNPGSHAGTEWLHLSILETKSRLQANPRWLETHSVLETDSTGRKPADVLNAIDYQMNERLRFVVGEDPIVADLFYQAALLAGGHKAKAKRDQYLMQSLRFSALRKTEAIAMLSR
jgi:hypothetical protein